MSTDILKDSKPIRLVFELARADHPRLYDDLIRFHKGTKRVNRLRVLAYDGLLAQSGVFAGIGHGLPARRQLPWPVDVNYPGRWKRGMRGSAFRL